MQAPQAQQEKNLFPLSYYLPYLNVLTCILKYTENVLVIPSYINMLPLSYEMFSDDVKYSVYFLGDPRY